MTKTIKIKDAFIFLNKSKIKAGAGLNKGSYPFYTSSSNLNKYLDSYEFEGESLIFGSGGSASVHHSYGKFSTSTDCFVLQSNNKYEIDLRYVYLFLSGNIHILENGFKGAGLKHISKKYLEDIEIPLLSLETQKKIVEILDMAQNLIDKRKEQIRLMDELIQSVFYEMFGELKEYPTMALIDCTDFIDYRGKTPVLSNNGTIRIINAKSIGKGFFKYVDEFVTKNTYDKLMTRGFPKYGDILFVTEGHTFGNVCIIPNNLDIFAMGQRVIVIQGKQNIVNNSFLATYMQTEKFAIAINKHKTGSSAKGIRSKELGKIQIPIPDFDIQKIYLDFIGKIDKWKLETQDSLYQIQTLFYSLMQTYFK